MRKERRKPCSMHWKNRNLQNNHFMLLIKTGCGLKRELCQNVDFTLENQVTMILATILMKQVTITL